MPIENYLAFVLATLIVLIIPGPSVIMAVGQAIAHGRRAVLPTVLKLIMRLSLDLPQKSQNHSNA